jgi:non-heme chloroperoxidase
MRLGSVRSLAVTLVIAIGVCRLAAAQPIPGTQSRFFSTSDGVRLHYLEAGPHAANAIVLVPGWTMPAWIWRPQIIALGNAYHVVAFDPRGQGESQVSAGGYTPERRGRDITELLVHLGPTPALVIAWSLGVLDTLAGIHINGDAHLAGLVLVDNSVGEEPPPKPEKPRPGPRLTRAAFMHDFVQNMFHSPQSSAYLDRLTEATLRTPETAASALLSYPVPRTYWREAVYAARVPVLYVVRPGFAAQAANLRRNRPDTETAVFADAGHALFVDDAARFNTLVLDFIHRHVWP